MKSSTRPPVIELSRLCFLILLLLLPQTSRAGLVGPYTPDANTLFLFHFNEPVGGTATLNVGTKGRNAYAVDQNPASATAPAVNTMLGAAGYVNGAINFGTCMTNPADIALQEGFCFAFDANNNGLYQGEGAAPAPDAFGMTNLNIGAGGQSPFTIEALIQPTTTAGNQEIMATDSSSVSRAFQFRISAGSLQFSFITGGQAITRPIPATGPHGFVVNDWYHVAVTYDGTIATLYWTKLDPAHGAANVLGTEALTLGAAAGAVVGPLIIGNENRGGAGEQFLGSIDEMRISSVARAANEMQFFSPLVTITAQSVSQNVDYNQPVTFSISAASQTPLSYQWRLNSNPIPGLTSSAFTITNVAAGDAGDYDCVITNTAGYGATSSVARLVVGAANFLANRYSFTTDTTDSVGGQDGTNFGGAYVTGGTLVLDGSFGTYLELPGGLYNATNATALTVEFWASFGVNANWARVFDFGYTNQTLGNIVGANYFSFSPRNGTGGHQLMANSASDPLFEQRLIAPGILDGQTVHVACVFDPPNQSLAIYTNGVLEAVNTNLTIGVGSLNNAFSYFGRSLFPNDPYLNATIDEIRIFKGALSPITIKQSQDQGPDTLLADGPAQFVVQPTNTTVVAGQTVTFTAAAVGYLPITYQWFQNGSPVPDATNASCSFSTALADNGATIQCWATNTIGVTTYVTNSTAATLTVFVPPTLAWLDFANGAISGDWDTFSPNWTNRAGGPITTYTPLDAVLFDTQGSGSPTVNLTQPLNPSKVTVDAGADYVLTSFGLNGWLTGQGAITKQGGGKLTIDITNNLTGGTLIAGGTLQIGNGGITGTTGAGNITNHGTLAFFRADSLNVGNVIRGPGSVQVDMGTVTLSGANEYTGPTAINGGIVLLPGATGLGSGNAGTTVASGAQLYLTGNQPVPDEALTLNGVGDLTGALRKGGAGLTVYGGAITLASDATIGVDGGATLMLTNVPGLAGPGVLTKNGTGTLALNSAGTYANGTILDTGILAYNANGAFGSGPVSTTPTATGRIILGDGTSLANAITADSVNPGAALGFVMTGDNTNNTVTTISGPMTFNADALSGGHLAGPTTSGRLDVTGPVNLGGIATALNVRLGNLRLAGGGSYPEIQVRANTTSLGDNNGIAATAVMDLAGNGSPTVPTYFDLNGFNQTLAGLKNTVNPANLGVVTNSGMPATLTLDLGAGGSHSFNGNLMGNLALRLNSGTQILGGTNSYSGTTTVAGGTLQLVRPTLAASSTVIISNTATLQLDFGGTNSVAALVLNGANQPAGVYNNNTSPTYLTGPGSLLVSAVATTPTNLTAVIVGDQYQLSWPASHTGWRLEAQTNSLATGLTGDWATVPGSTNANQINVPMNPANGTVFFRLAYP